MKTALDHLKVSPIAEVGDCVWDDWQQVLDATPQLHSPFLRPEFVRCVGAAQENVMVARWETEQGPAFFPFQQVGRSIEALGLGLAEWQAVVTSQCGLVDWPALLSCLDARALRFDHFYAWQWDATPHTVCGAVPWMNLAGGFEHYLQRRRAISDSLIKQTLRKDRKLAREVGAVELQYDAPFDEAMDVLFRWKRGQHARTGVPDAFTQPLVAQLLHQVARCKGDHFRGRLTLLRSGGRPIAVHLGVETQAAAHMWYPAYDPEFAKYSPGNVLFLRLAEAMAECGIQRFDFGPGGQSYKDRFKTDDDFVVRGVLDSHWAIGFVRRQSDAVRRLAGAVKRRTKKLIAWSGSKKEGQHVEGISKTASESQTLSESVI